MHRHSRRQNRARHAQGARIEAGLLEPEPGEKNSSRI